MGLLLLHQIDERMRSNPNRFYAIEEEVGMEGSGLGLRLFGFGLLPCEL